jgi:hypothetical protein
MIAPRTLTSPHCDAHFGRASSASFGLMLRLAFLGRGGLFEILPGSSIKLVGNQVSFWMAWLIEICGEHVDNRQAIFEEDADGSLDAYFVDHGHLFGVGLPDLLYQRDC